MKQRRHRQIIDIINSKLLATQDELAEELRRAGFEVTQATISRDIKELRLVKIPAGAGFYRYTVPRESAPLNMLDRLRRLAADSMVSIDSSENLIVVKTLPGTAHAVAAALDGVEWPEVIGTVAGDDTILLIIKPREAVTAIIDRFSKLVHEEQ